MKTTLTAFILCASACLAAALVIVPIDGHLRFTWRYDLEPANTNLSFNFYSATNIPTPLSNWLFYTNIVSTDALNTNDGSYFLDFTSLPGGNHYLATSSNLQGESITSNVITTPPYPQSITTLKIEKRP
jgi:hypothetical protein